MALLEVKGLKTHFFMRRGVVKAVDDVSFSIDKGETLGLVGESGSGKSVTSLSILRLVPTPGRNVGGSVTFDGVNLLSLSDKEMRGYRGRHLSMILQDPLSSLNPVFSIGDQVGEGIAIHDKVKGKPLLQRVVETLGKVAIPAAETRVGDYPHQFSGGMRQRVVGAVCLACSPHFLIADEPTTSLDVTIQRQYLNLLKSIQQREQLAMMFVTHDYLPVRIRTELGAAREVDYQPHVLAVASVPRANYALVDQDRVGSTLGDLVHGARHVDEPRNRASGDAVIHGDDYRPPGIAVQYPLKPDSLAYF